MIRLLLIPSVMALTACANTAPPTGGIDAPEAPPASCDAEKAQQFVGRQATDAIGRSILSMSNSRSLRWGGPDTAFTMDYREGRVNAIYDTGGIIIDIYCG